MVRKKLAIAILALSALQANIADAMGLGNLTVRSALNQPLNAEIKLLDTGDLDASQIKIQLASPEDFLRAGVDRDYFLTNLRFTVDMDGSGGATIKITTREPVVEPYLNFVIEARWPSGRLLREFAVLLDPPTFSASKAATPVAPATGSGAQPVKPRAAQPPVVKTETESAKTAPEADMSLPAADKSGEYRVQVYDTLSKIAARFKPANDVSVAQTMIAIQRANPQVFIRNNVNLIKSGYVLRLPGADEVRAVSAEQATQDIDTQMQEWRGGRSSGATAAPPAATGPQLDASAPAPSSKEGGYREQARLSIATAGEADKTAKGGGGSGKGVDALRQQLTESQEALEKGKRDNKELQSRLDDMERQIATLQRLISLKDEQLAALQANAAAGAKSAPKAAATETAATAAPTPATAESGPAAPAGASPEAAAPAPTPAPLPAPAPKPAAVAAKPIEAAPEQGLASKLIADPAYLYGGLAALVLALVSPFIFKRFKKREEEAETESLAFDADDTFRFDTDAFDEPKGESAAADTAADISEDVAEAAPAAEEPKKAVRSETGDPIAESDIYIAYGRYQQAVDLLTNAIDAEPNRSDLRMKLLEVYVEMRNKDAFRQQFVALQALGDSGAIAHVKDLLSSVDGISDWLDNLPGGSVAAVAAAATAAASAAPAPDIDLDFDAEPSAEMAVESKSAFEADLGDNLEALETSFAAEADIASEENPVEFDLELDDELLAGEGESELAESFLSEPETTPGSEPVASLAAEGFDSSFETPDFDVSPVSDSTSTESEFAATEEGLELDLGDDDLDQALSNLGEPEGLGDLDDMSSAPGEVAAHDQEPVDLGGDFDSLSDEFDLSQPSTDLPVVERASAGDFGEVNLDEPVEEPAAEAQPEIDVFAGLNEPAPAVAEQPAVAAPTLEGGDDFDFLADADEVATKLDLARAYIDMGDTDGAKDILDEVMQDGTDTQKQEASTLLSRIG